DAADGEADAEHDDKRADRDPRVVDAAGTGRARGEFRVTPVEVPLHLVEQSLLVLGEGHAEMIRRGAVSRRALSQDAHTERAAGPWSTTGRHLSWSGGQR